MVSRVVSFLLATLRVGLGALLIVHPASSVLVKAAGLLEVGTGTAAMFNAMAAKFGRGWRGWLVPLAYHLGMVIVPTRGETLEIVDAGLFVALAFQAWCFLHLGLGYSVGPPSFLSLSQRGPFGWVRHPMAVSGVVMRLLICVGNPSLQNWMCWCIFGGAAVVSVRAEESFLCTVEAWRKYAVRVRWRLVPGVW
jgi:hypothetical protein